jgi:hypothetical protein
MKKSGEFIGWIIIFTIFAMLIDEYTNCGGTLVRTLFWVECL